MVTSLEELRNRTVKEVTLSGWDEEPFVCKLKRVSILDLSASGKIPNGLMKTVIAIFDKKLKLEKETDIKNMAEVVNLFCRSAMVEPTYDEVEAIIPLTDEQRLQIWDFTQNGIKKITPSNPKQGNVVDPAYDKNVPEIAK